MQMDNGYWKPTYFWRDQCLQLAELLKDNPMENFSPAPNISIAWLPQPVTSKDLGVALQQQSCNGTEGEYLEMEWFVSILQDWQVGELLFFSGPGEFKLQHFFHGEFLNGKSHKNKFLTKNSGFTVHINLHDKSTIVITVNYFILNNWFLIIMNLQA